MFRQMLKNYNLFRIGTSSELKPHINLKKRIVTAVTNSAGTVSISELMFSSLVFTQDSTLHLDTL